MTLLKSTSGEALLEEGADAAGSPWHKGVVRETAASLVVKLRRHLRLALMLGGILVVVLAATAHWLRAGRYVSTDNSYVRAAKLMVSTDVSGLVSSVEVHEGQLVKAGDVLFRIDPRQYQLALDSAKAALAQTALALEAMKQDYKRMQSDIAAQEAKVGLDQATYDRYKPLAHENYLSKANFDQARFALEADKNQLESLRQQARVQLIRLSGDPDVPVAELPQYLQAKAQAGEAERQLDHTAVRAPFDGRVTQVASLQPGTYLVAQTAALTNTGAVGLVSTGDIWVEANMKETDLTHVKQGDPVEISIDTYPGKTWKGVVDSIAPASGAEFSILPAQNSSGNWVKVVQRIPVRIKITSDFPDASLRSGMSVTVTIDTGHRNSFINLS
jgi:membrane fusion protein, multidrug efflux system